MIRVVCLGNELRADDGVGIHVGHLLEARGLPQGVELEYLPSAGLDLLDVLVAAELVVLVDALRTGAAAGSCLTLEIEAGPADRAPGWCHGAKLTEVLEVARHLRPKKDLPRVVVVGVEARELDLFSTELSAPVAAALPAAVREVLRIVGVAHPAAGAILAPET